jgi:hypothetical protein
VSGTDLRGDGTSHLLQQLKQLNVQITFWSTTFEPLRGASTRRNCTPEIAGLRAASDDAARAGIAVSAVTA